MTAVALDVSQLKVADCPAVIVVGMAVKLSMVTVGGGGGGWCRERREHEGKEGRGSTEPGHRQIVRTIVDRRAPVGSRAKRRRGGAAVGDWRAKTAQKS